MNNSEIDAFIKAQVAEKMKASVKSAAFDMALEAISDHKSKLIKKNTDSNDEPISAKQSSMTADRFVSKEVCKAKANQPPKSYILSSTGSFSKPDAVTRSFIAKANESKNITLKRSLGQLLDEKGFLRKQDRVYLTADMAHRLKEVQLLLKESPVSVSLLSEAN
ncbi:hypothetical protein CQ054_04335 [Ochrobactrum sp. MYb29]|nr:hypothetical protein CQ054_04335 [Ochrobactrum sp. MYb29]